MKDRIILLIKAKNLTAAQFADEIGVQKSSISHIISGRNNASLDFIQKVLQRYPEVNMDWLMFGKGPLFKGAETAVYSSIDGQLNAVSSQVTPPVDLFSELNPTRSPDYRKENDLIPQLKPEGNPYQEEIASEATSIPVKQNMEQDSESPTGKPENSMASSGHKYSHAKTLVKIVEFYSDNTYREYFPE